MPHRQCYSLLLYEQRIGNNLSVLLRDWKAEAEQCVYCAIVCEQMCISTSLSFWVSKFRNGFFSMSFIMAIVSTLPCRLYTLATSSGSVSSTRSVHSTAAIFLSFQVSPHWSASGLCGNWWFSRQSSPLISFVLQLILMIEHNIDQTRGLHRLPLGFVLILVLLGEIDFCGLLHRCIFQGRFMASHNLTAFGPASFPYKVLNADSLNRHRTQIPMRPRSFKSLAILSTRSWV